MKVYVGFSKRPGNLLSNLIRIMDNADYSHVYLRVDSKYGEYVYQASGLQVNFMNIEIFKSHNVIVEEYEFDIADEYKTELLKFFIQYAGRDYSLKSLFKLAAIMLCDKVGIKLHMGGDGDQSFICSELGALFCVKMLGIDIPEDEDFITPHSLNPYVKAYGKRVI